MPASQNGTNAMYAKRRPASYLQGNKKQNSRRNKYLNEATMMKQLFNKPTYHLLFQRLFSP